MSRAFQIFADAAQEVPAATDTGAGAIGYAVFDDTATTLTYLITVTGLDFGTTFGGSTAETPSTDDDVIAAHFHLADRGVNGPVAFNLFSQDADDFVQSENPDDSQTLTGIWETTDPASTSLTTLSAALDATPVGSDAGVYLNIHTTGIPSGAIRGQLVAMAGPGDDTLDGTAGTDFLVGLGGNDTYTVNVLGDVVIEDPGAGTDRVNYSAPATSYALPENLEELYSTGLSLSTDLSGNILDNLMDGNDELAARLHGLGGDDTLRHAGFLFGGEGNDTLIGSLSTAEMHGEGGNDSLLGVSDSSEILDGGSGDDTLDGGGNGDTLIGGPGDDYYVVNNLLDVVTEDLSGGIDEIFYRNPADTFFELPQQVEKFSVDSGLFSLLSLTGNSGDNLLDLGGIMNSSAMAESGNDTITGAEVSHGGGGNDSLIGSSNSTWHYGEAGDDTVSGGDNGEFIYGGTGNDSLVGGGGDDTISGSSFDESVAEDGGNDLILGGDGNDNLRGGFFGGHPLFDPLAFDGDDTLEGGAGDDTLTGGTGNDVLRGQLGTDSLYGGRGNDNVEGGEGDDRLDGNEDNDTLIGGEGVDSLLGGTGTDSLLGGVGDDQLRGGEGADTLLGDAGDDVLSGESGNDSLLGGGGIDTARYTLPSAAATVSAGDPGTTIVASSEGTDTLTGVERIAFLDETIDIDSSSSGPGLRIEGDATQGETLTAIPINTSGLVPESFRFHWLRDGLAISPPDIDDGRTFVLSQDDVGSDISVQLDFIDTDGTPGRIISPKTTPVENINDPASGFVTISGVNELGETLVVETSGLGDLDGLGSFTYQWRRNGEDIEGAASLEYVVTPDDVGAVLSVRVSYTDGFGTEESVIGSLDASGDEAVIQVTTTSDILSATDGETSLREAVLAANSFAGHTTILLASGEHALSRSPVLEAGEFGDDPSFPTGTFMELNTTFREAAGNTEANAASGDLDLVGNITIVGAAGGSSAISNGMTTRSFHIHSGSDVTFRNFAIGTSETGEPGPDDGLRVQDGGIILNTGGDLVIDNVALRNALMPSEMATFVRNAKKGSAISYEPSRGGAIFNESGTIEISDSLIENNRATFGGAIYANDGRVEVQSTVIHSNEGYSRYDEGFAEDGSDWSKFSASETSKSDGRGVVVFSESDAQVLILRMAPGSASETQITSNTTVGEPRGDNSLISAEGGSVFVEDGINLTGVGNNPETLVGVSRGPLPDASLVLHRAEATLIEAVFAAAVERESAVLAVADGFELSYERLWEPDFVLTDDPIAAVSDTEIVVQLAGARLIIAGSELVFPADLHSLATRAEFLEIVDGIVETITLTNATGDETLASLSGLNMPANEIIERALPDDFRELPTLEAIVGSAVTTDDAPLVDLSLTGTPEADGLFGGAGMDTIAGLAGNDRILGEVGADFLNGGGGSDTLNGGEGNDTILGGNATSDLRDVIYAGEGHDSVDAGAGNDLVFGQGGNDTVAGGAGVDELQGQDGDDVITGSNFSDLVFGGAGDDFVNGGFGHDRINGGSGADKFFHAGVLGHGSDWVQDYVAADGDVLLWGGAPATAEEFQVNFAHTASAAGERSGDDAVQEAFVIYKPTEQIIWALVDGAGQDQINIQIGGDTFSLLL